MTLAMLCESRALVEALDGHQEAADSFYSEARLSRAYDAGQIWPRFSGLSLVLERTRPSATVLARLGGSLADIDRDDQLKQNFVRWRATMLGDLLKSRAPSLQPGPLVTHLTVRSLDALSSLIAEADEPWTTRLAAVNAVGVWPAPNLWSQGGRGRTMLEGYTRSVAEQMKRIRCARLLVAGGRLDLVDPLSGNRLAIGNCRL